MMVANSCGMRLRLDVETLGCRVSRWVPCDPGTGTLSPSTGLWYPGGETKRRLTLEVGCDSVHMYSNVVVSSYSLFTYAVLCTI